MSVPPSSSSSSSTPSPSSQPTPSQRILPTPSSSPFLNPFQLPRPISPVSNRTIRREPSPDRLLTPKPSIFHLSDVSPSSTTISSCSPLDLNSPPSDNRQFVQTAYIASRSSADLIRILDSASGGTDSGDQGGGPPVAAIVEKQDQLRPATKRASFTTANPITTSSTMSGTEPSLQTKTTELQGSLIDHRVSNPRLSTYSTSTGTPSQNSLSQRSTRRSGPLLNDRSFLRLSTTTASFSDFAPSSSLEGIPLRAMSNASGEELVVCDGDVASRRSSAGTFGRNRRWSVSTSSVAGLEGTGSFRGARQASETFLSDNEDGDDGHSNTSSQRRRRRHQSLSSSSASGATSGPMPSEVIAIHNAKGLFPSPTQPQRTHRKPESDAAITAHLLKSASRDPRKIVPTTSTSSHALSPAIRLHPPSSGTPLKHGLVDEDAKSVVTSDDDSIISSPKQRDPAKTQSKIEQVLGQGAIEAGTQMALERQAWQDAVHIPQRSPGPVPPYRGHRVTASTPSVPVSPHSKLSPSPRSPHGRYDHTTPEHQLHGRSVSLDSLPSSLHPSIADSITHLIPQSHLHSPTAQLSNMRALPPTPLAVCTDNPRKVDLSLELLSPDDPQTQMQRRIRALEKRLGERLKDDGTGKLVIQPSEGAPTILAEVPDFWPPTPNSSVPEWARDDVVPRTTTAAAAPVAEPLAPVRSNTIRRRAKAALGLEDDKSTTADNLKIYVGRQTQVSHIAKPASATRLNRQHTKSFTKAHAKTSNPISPLDYDTADEEEIMAQNRRRQLAKLQSLLGEALTPAYLPPSRPQSPNYHRSLERVESPLSDQTSFMDMSLDDLSAGSTPQKEKEPGLRGQWTNRLKQTMSSGKTKSRLINDDDSFMNLGRSSGTWKLNNSRNSVTPSKGAGNDVFSIQSASDTRKPVAQKGDATGYDHTALPRSSISGEARRERHSDSYDGYKQSLQGLIYLAENNPNRLAKLVDSLDDTATSVVGTNTVPAGINVPGRRNTPSPPTPVLKSPTSPKSHMTSHPYRARDDYLYDIDPNSDEAKRKRSGKLSNFFGEDGVDFTAPNVPAPRRRAARYDHHDYSENQDQSVRGGSGRTKKSRVEVLDGMLGEMWRAVQAEVRKGGLRRDELDRLGDMFNVFNKQRRESLGGWEEL